MTRKEEYAQYLLTDVWQAKKVSALKRAGNKCEKCERAYKLHVHHSELFRIINLTLGKRSVML